MFTPPADLAAGTYRAWVRAGNSAGFGQWSRLLDFTVTAGVQTPARPTLTAPSGTVMARPELRWDAVSGATTYDLWVDNRSTGEEQVIREQNLTTTTFTSAADFPAGTYRAWVRAGNTAGFGEWSRLLDFTVAASVQIPARPTLAAPAGTVTSRPDFRWDTVADATVYDLWVDNRTNGEEQVIREQSLTTTTFTPSTALPAGNYRAWVRAGNSAGFGEWSSLLDFNVDEGIQVPARPNFFEPYRTLTSARPRFGWQDFLGREIMASDLWVDNLTTGEEQVIREQNIATTTFTPATDLPPGMYRAWVRAANSAGFSSWSVPVDFTIDRNIPVLARPTLTAPTGTVGSRPEFHWNEVTGAGITTYVLRVDNLTTGESHVINRHNIATTMFTALADLPAGTYRAQVSASSSNSDSAWSQPIDFTVVPTVNVADVTQPSDPIIGTSTNSPAGEEVQFAIDNNVNTKYLNADINHTGFTVTPNAGPSIVTGLLLTSANDEPDRDPTTFLLEGSNDGVTFTQIAAGDVPFSFFRFETQVVQFENDQSFRTYRLTFPTVNGSPCCMQIAEVEFMGRVLSPPPLEESLFDAVFADIGSALDH